MSRWTLLAVLVIGCGIPEEVHTQVVRDLDKCRQDLANARADLAAARDATEPGVKPPATQRGSGGVETPTPQREAAELGRTREELAHRTETFRRVGERLKPILADSGARIIDQRDRMSIVVPASTLYESDTVELRAPARALVGKLAAALKEALDVDFLVVGHTPAKPPGGRFRSNWELSAQRGVTLVTALQREGIDPRRLTAAGASEFDPIAADDAVEIRLVSANH
jgi:chemotaxis protein MotB